MHDEIMNQLQFLYGKAQAPEVYARLEKVIGRYKDLAGAKFAKRDSYFSERDAVLITYGDMVQTPGEQPLRTLNQFLTKTIGGSINTIHILPFFPYSSDDGFSIIDYRQVNPALGDWGDISSLNETFSLMFDAVVNHLSAQSQWFEDFLAGRDPFQDFFIVVPPDIDLSQVFRPRSLPLLTEVETHDGPKHVWTTFSADQIDLNFASPDVLLAVIDTLLFYVQNGADLIRLDAIAYIWKKLDTSCIHLPQTHSIIQLMRSVLDIIAPHVILVTETNVPHEDNISYFGDGTNEAQMVYNFSLPPLTLHAIQQGNAEVLTRWAKTLDIPSPRVTFFNFLASHDGIGLTPARGLLDDEEVQEIADRVQKLGGFVSYRSNPDGSESPYELNISFIDALAEPGKKEDDTLTARRFLVAQAIMLALRGVPGIYFHSLFGSRSWFEGVQETGQNRTINRQKLDRYELESALEDSNTLRSQVFFPFMNMLRKRADEASFHPTGEQEVIALDPALFSLWRYGLSGEHRVLCLHNVTNSVVKTTVELPQSQGQIYTNLFSGESFSVIEDQLKLEVPPYGMYWLRPE
jgi:sucrose phosphorylase